MQITESQPPVSSPRDSRPRRMRLAAAAALTVVGIIAAAWFVTVRPISQPAPKVVPYSALLSGLTAGTVDSIAIVPGEQVLGWTSEGPIRVLYTSTEVEPLVARAESAGTAIAFRRSPRGVLGYANVAIGLIILTTLVIVLGAISAAGAAAPGRSWAKRWTPRPRSPTSPETTVPSASSGRS